MCDSKDDRSGEKTVSSGTGAGCAEAQADGVPCTTLGRDCEECEKAAEARREQSRAD